MTQIEIKKINKAFDVNTEAMPDNAKAFIFNYGLKQILNDCHSQVNKNTVADIASLEAEVSRIVLAKIAALESGDLTIKREGSAGVKLTNAIKALALAKYAISNGNDTEESILSAKYAAALKDKGAYDKILGLMATKYGKDSDSIHADVLELAREHIASLGDTAEEMSDLV